jgi:SAM-dependent methyltransferase
VSQTRTRPDLVVTAYDAGAPTYAELWSPMLVPAGQALLDALPLAAARVVVDLGVGTGAMVPALRLAAPEAAVLGVDLSVGMLREARRRTGVPVALMSLDRPALRAASADAAVMCFVLFHLPDPDATLAAVAATLRPGGAFGCATWAVEEPFAPDVVWRGLLDAADGGAPATTRCDDGLDTPDGLSERLRTAGLIEVTGWLTPVSRRFTLDDFVTVRTASGSLGLRFSRLGPLQQEELLAQARARLTEIPDDQWTMHGEAVLATGRRAG